MPQGTLEYVHFSDDEYFNPQPGLAMCAVGWLERGYPYRRGNTPAEVLQRLQELLSEPLWEPYRLLGYHQCDLGFCGGRLTASVTNVNAFACSGSFNFVTHTILLGTKTTDNSSPAGCYLDGPGLTNTLNLTITGSLSTTTLLLSNGTTFLATPPVRGCGVLP